MTRTEQFLRLLYVLKKIRVRGEASFIEINDYLREKSEETGYLLSASRRSLQRDIKDIAFIFDIEIKNYSMRKYYIEYDGHTQLHERIFESFDYLPVLNLAKDISANIFPEKHEKGTKNIYEFLHAIRNRFIVKFRDNKYQTYEIFRNCFGIVIPDKKEVELIILSFTP